MITNQLNNACLENLPDKLKILFEKELILEICQVGKTSKVLAHTELMSIGETITYIPLILSGSLKVMMEDKNGEELLLYYLELGDTCAMTLKCCSNFSKSIISATTEEPTEILFIPVEFMEKWMVKYSSWRNFVLDSYNNRMSELLSAIDNLAFHNMEERLYKYLNNKVTVTKSTMLNITHLQIANDLNSSRVVISRLMKKLENEGIIKQYRNRVDFLKLDN